VRGATNKILSTIDSSLKRGVVAASAGNHGQGIAVAARSAGIPATVVMPAWSSLSKQEATRSYGAQVIIHGTSLEDSITKAQEIARKGPLFIHPYDDDAVIAGQGTIALEILDDLPETDMIVVPVGGGGLIAGIATAAKAKNSGILIIGAQAQACASAVDAITRRVPSRIQEGKTIADGIRVAETGSHTLPIILQNVDHIVLASEEEIADAMLLLLERKHIVAEGAAAVPLAVFMNGSIFVKPGSNVVLVISGGNIESAQLFKVVRWALSRKGRIMHFSVMLDDHPGTLARLLFVIAQEQGNILHIHHSTGENDLPILSARVEIELETRGKDHSITIKKKLADNGYEIRLL
jgi:threonine dehydratase